MRNNISTTVLNDHVKTLEHYIAKVPQIDLKTEMVVHAKMCARTIFLPKGTLGTGAKLNLDTISIISGDVTITSPDGPVRLTGYNIVPSIAGYKRAAIAHEDTYWTALHYTDLTDPFEITKEMTDECENLQYKAVTKEGKPLCLGE